VVQLLVLHWDCEVNTRLNWLCLALIALPSTNSAQSAPYTVSKGVITSQMQPEIRLKLDSTLQYVGSQRWVLYDVTQAEQHLFVQKSAAGVERFVWVQFEEYIPSVTSRYDYSGDAPLTAFGKELRTSKTVWTVPTTEQRPASDGAHARQLLREHGVGLPSKMLYERFIYLPDPSHRRELMVIYATRLSSRDSSAAATKEGLEALLAAHEKRALATFAIVTP
jgi:hypothetical protein